MLRPTLLLAALAAFATPAWAADFAFVSGDGSVNPFTFAIPTHPVPDASDAVSFTILGVSTNEAGPFGPLIYDADYTFYTDGGGGGFENGFVAYFGAQMFGGDVTAPVFYNGTYELSDFGGGPTVATLTITNAEDAPGGAVPEPATWGLMMLGFGAVGGAMRRRSTRVGYAA